MFHLSLIYAGSLEELSWRALHDRSRRTLEPRPAEIITSAEFVWYANGVEHVQTLRFSAQASNARTPTETM